MGNTYANRNNLTASDTRRGFLGGAACALLALISGCGQPPINSDLQASKTMTSLPTTPTNVPQGKEIATIAGGCFWCVDTLFKELKGVDKVESGYAGGAVVNPSYDAVCSGRTGHAEAVQITFDPNVISFADLLHIFFTVHDPTTLNRQGADAGTQYRSAIFTHSEAQNQTAQDVIKEVNAQHIWDNPAVTEVTAFTNFYPAEGYHQDYYTNNPNQGYCRIVIAPKVLKFRSKYGALLKK